MGNGANRLFNVMKKTSQGTNIKPSQVVVLTVKSVQPLIFMRDDRLEITEEFCTFNKTVSISSLKVGDKITAFVFNEGQKYFIQQNNSQSGIGGNYEDLTNKPQINGIELVGNITPLQLGLATASQLDNYLTLLGGTLSGKIIFGNKDAFAAIDKYRTVNDIDYVAKLGVGAKNNKGTATLELSSNETILGRIDVMPDGTLYNHKTGGTFIDSTGGTITGIVKFENKVDFGAIQKIRTVNGSDYTGIFGVGNISNTGTTALELQSSDGSVLGRADLMSGNIFKCNIFRFANGSTYGIQNANGDFIIRDHNNNNVTVDATGATLFLGWSNTTGIDILNGKLNIDSTGKLTYGTAGLFAPTAGGVYFNQYGNIVTAQAMTSGAWRMQNNGVSVVEAHWADNTFRTRHIYPLATNTYNLGHSNYYWKEIYAQHLKPSVKVTIPNNGAAGYGLTNADGTSIIRDHANKNVTIGATGGVLYLGYQNTTSLNFMNGKATMDSSGNLSCNKVTTSNDLVVGDQIFCDSGAMRSAYSYNNDTVTNSANMYITSNGWFRRTTGSSKRWKKDITEQIEDRLNPEALYNLPIKQFKYKDDSISKDDIRYGKNILGFIAEDVAEVYEPAVQYDEKGQVEMWNNQVMVPAILKLVQNEHKEQLEHKALLQEQSNEINSLKQIIKELQDKINSLI